MPPLRQAPTLILPGGNVVDDFHGGATGAVHGHVAHVTTRISLRAFFLLLVGTVVIFGLTIAVWHLGAFLRRFSRAKVVGAKTGPPQRYAKTWHGWVDLEKHQARERRRRHWAGRALVLLGLSKPHYRDAEVWHYGGAGFAPASGLAPPRAQAAPPVTPQQAAAIQVPVTTRASTAAPTLGLAHPYSQRVYHPVTRSGRQELLSRLHARLMHAGEVAREPLSTIRSNRSEPPALSAASLSPSGTCTSKQRATQQLHAQLPAASTPTPTPTPTRDPAPLAHPAPAARRASPARR
ncbi:hypothetical protein KEM52_000168 [Ascosphaera acerosa]|nr:hypothetical protein KEM52_000168 [Ascosphaera acerosa]